MIAANPIPTYTVSLKNPLYPNSKRSSGRLCLSVCKSKDEGSSSDSEASQPEGDQRKQELLAKIAMIQVQKLRLTDYLDERSAFLTRFAEEANAEIDAIGENALKDLDNAAARIMESIESRMQEFEESMEINKREAEKRDKELQDLESEIERGRNEGMFFQSFQRRAPIDKAKAKEETKKITAVAHKNAGSKTRRNVYLALTGLLSFAIAGSFVSGSPPDWRKVAVLGAIFVALLTQFINEQNMVSENEKDDDGMNNDEERR